MSQERFLTVPSTGEVARPFEVLLDEASAALPADFPTSAGQVLVALDIDGTILTPAGATPRVREGIHGLAGVRIVPGPILEEIAAAVPGSVFASMPHPALLLSAPFPNNEIEGSEHRIVSMEELASTPTPKIVVRAADMDRDVFDSVLSSLDVSRTHEVFVGWTSWADIEPLGVTKATGLESLRARLGVPAAGTVAVGDGTNDIAMIEWAAFGVAMGGASDEVRSHADHVTAAVENDGAAAVMHAIMRRCGVAGR